MWSLYVNWPVVSAEVMGNSEYYGEEAAAGGDGRGCVGRSVEKWHSEMPLRQRSCGGYLKQQVSQGNETNLLLVCVCSNDQCGVGSRACARGRKWGSRCTNLPSFFRLVPGDSQSPLVVPRQLVQALVEHPVEWTSKNWRRQLKTSLATPSLKAQETWGGDSL